MIRTLLALFTTLIFSGLVISCNKKSSVSNKKESVTSVPATAYEKFIDKSLTLTLPHDGLEIPPAVVSLEISYTGKTGVEKAFKENENLILNLIRTKAANFSLAELRKGDDLSRFENEVLKSINGFVANDMFIKVRVSNLREI